MTTRSLDQPNSKTIQTRPEEFEIVFLGKETSLEPFAITSSSPWLGVTPIMTPKVWTIIRGQV